MVGRWRRLEGAQAALLVLAVLAAIFACAIALLSQEKRSDVLAVLFGLVAVGAAVKPVIELTRDEKAAEEELQDAMHPYPASPVGTIDPYRTLGVEPSVREDRSRAPARPPYIRRSPYDRQLDNALRQHRFALLVAPPGWGKSRSAYEAARRLDVTALLISPSRPENLPIVVKHRRLWNQRGRRSILWLDDVDRYVSAGSLDSGILHRILKQHGIAVIATARSRNRAALNSLRDLPVGATIEPAERLTTEELDAARALYAQGDFSRGIGQWFCSPTRLSHAYRDPDHHLGRQLVHAAVDWRRCGLGAAAPVEVVRALVRAHHEGDIPDAAIDVELQWATGEVPGTGGALLIQERGSEHVRASELAVADDEGDFGREPRPVSKATWTLLIEVASTEQAANLADAARERFVHRRQLDDPRTLVHACEAAATKAAEGGSSKGLYLLGILRFSTGDRVAAKEYLRQAADSGNREAARAYGYLLTSEAHEEGAERAKALRAAEHYYHQAIREGDAQAAVNLATLKLNEGDLVNAKDLYQQAVCLGLPTADTGVALVLERQGHPDQAEVRALQAVEAGAVPAMSFLGALLEKQGRFAEAEEWYRRAAAEGADDGVVPLGQLLYRRGATREAQAQWRLAADRGDRRAQKLLVTAAEAQGDEVLAQALVEKISQSFQAELGTIQEALDEARRGYFDVGKLLYEQGDLEEAEPYFREAASAGHLEATFALGVVAEERGLNDQAEAAYRKASDAGHADAQARIATLLAVRDPREAELLLEGAARAGGPEGQYRLGQLREQQNRPFEAMRWYRQAAPRHSRAAWALVELLGEDASVEESEAARDAAYVEGCRLVHRHRDLDAESWLRRAVEMQHAGAMFELSMLLSRRGEKTEARHYQLAAAEHGHPLARMLNDLGQGHQRTDPAEAAVRIASPIDPDPASSGTAGPSAS